MGDVRPFVKEDISQVADLHRRVFSTGDAGCPGLVERYQSYFREVFLDNPWSEDGLPSLVYREEDGRVMGFLGVLPRRMLMNGQLLRVAVASQAVVHPNRRGLAGLKLLKVLLDGPQDLTMADESNDASRRIWEAGGGTTSLLYSFSWLRLLRPTQFALAFLKKRKSLPPFASVSSPFAHVLDASLARAEQWRLRQSTSRLIADDLNEETFLAALPEFAGNRSLRPHYDHRSVNWVLERARPREANGCLWKMVVKRDNQNILGWYLYYVKSDGIAEVLQIVAKKHSIHEVLDHLLSHASLQGVIALSGRLDPAFVKELSDSYCLFHARGPWMLIHSRKPELLGAIQRGDAFLTRLEGEWCARFQVS
jgi:hypothetical protein